MSTTPALILGCATSLSSHIVLRAGLGRRMVNLSFLPVISYVKKRCLLLFTPCRLTSGDMHA